MMKAIKIKKAGGPEVLELEDITLRKPLMDEVIIEHTAIGLNYIDTYHRSGLYPLIFPSGLGMEATGVIKETGPDVKGFAVGDKVAYASVPLGAYSTHRIFKTKSLVKVPDEIDLTTARRAGMEAQQLRAAANAPIQGSSADIIKLAMIQLHSALRKTGLAAKILLQVHDELVLEVNPKDLEETKLLVQNTMENALKLSVPLIVETGVGVNWMEAK